MPQQVPSILLFIAFVTLECESWLSTSLHSNVIVNRQSISNIVYNRNTKLYAEKEKLVFTANFDMVSDKLETSSSKKSDVYAFCRSKECRNHFVSAGGKLNMEELSWNDQLEIIWNDVSKEIYGLDTVPSKQNGDVMLATESKMQFPGVQLTNTVYMGIKLLKDNDDAPVYKFVMIADNKEVTGAPPLVWLFNKLTGTDTQSEYNPPTGRVETIISAVPVDDGYAIRFVCNAEIVTEFSKSLLKLLPASKEKIEEQGSVSVSKTIEKDVRSSLESVVKAYEEWKVASLVQHV